MSEVTQILERVDQGDTQAAEQLLPLVYQELRTLAAQKMAREPPGQTLQPTALVHEAWLRLIRGNDLPWPSRSYFFAAAAEAMRRILVERARRRRVLAAGGYADRTDLTDSAILAPAPDAELLDVNLALDGLESVDPLAAKLVKLRYFAGLSMTDTARALNLPLRSAERIWTFAKAWLRDALRRPAGSVGKNVGGDSGCHSQ